MSKIRIPNSILKESERTDEYKYSGWKKVKTKECNSTNAELNPAILISTEVLVQLFSLNHYDRQSMDLVGNLQKAKWWTSRVSLYTHGPY